MIKNEKKRTIAVITAALHLLEFPGMTIDGLRTLGENYIQAGGAKDEIDEMYYDSILAAIEMMTNPVFA